MSLAELREASSAPLGGRDATEMCGSGGGREATGRWVGGGVGVGVGDGVGERLGGNNKS